MSLLFDIFKEAGKALLQELIIDPKAPKGKAPTTAKRGIPKPPTRSKYDRDFKSIQFTLNKENRHVKISGKTLKGIYHFNYSFKDHKNKYQQIKLSWPIADMEQDSLRFGYPKVMTGSYRMSKSQMSLWHKKRDKFLKDGLFMINKKNLRPNPTAIVEFYHEKYCLPFAKEVLRILNTYGTDSRRERIELCMKLVQDIPYAVPKQNDPDYLMGGVVVPPQILFLRKGDCDSKSFFLAGILTYLIPSTDIAFLTVPGHLLTVIADKPEEGMAVIKSKRRSWVLAETAGPGRNNFGVPATYKEGKTSLEPLLLSNPPRIAAFVNQQGLKQASYQLFKANRVRTKSTFIDSLAKVRAQKQAIKSILFNDKGGWLILFGKNKVLAEAIPEHAVTAIKKAQKQDIEISDLALSNYDDFVMITANGNASKVIGGGKPLTNLESAIQRVSDKMGQPISEIEFTNHQEMGWTMIYGHNDRGFTCELPNKLLNAIKKPISSAAKVGIKSLSFNQNGGWAMIDRKNRLHTFLPKKMAEELSSAAKQLVKAKKRMDRIYFSPNDDWLIIYNGYQYVSSFK